MVRSVLRRYGLITLFSVLFALGFDWLFVPNGIGLGGMTALGQTVNFLFPALPVGTVVLVANIPLFLLGWKFLGGNVLLSSLYAMAATSVLVDLFDALFTFQPMEPILASIFGGAIIGLSLGVIFSQGATTGGTDLIARLLKLPFGWLPMGKLLLGVDLVLLGLVSLVFRSLESAMYGLIALYISSIVTDWVLYGMDSSKVAYIITREPRTVADAVLHELDRGVTVLKGEGAWSGEKRPVLMCAFKQRQIVVLKDLVHRSDPEAFMIVCNAHEVLGLGFRRYRKNDI